MVSKAEYAAWEQQVIATFYEPEHRATPLTPSDGAPSVLSKEKHMLVVDTASASVAAAASGLPAVRSVRLWHIGKQARDGVKLGLDGAEFKHPACDVGGLTNLKQKVGEAVTLDSASFAWPSAQPATEVADALLARWRTLSGKAMPAALAADLERWLASVAEEVGPATLRFHSLPSEHRVLVTPADVRRATGKYLVRVFGDPTRHAEHSDGAGLYCAVTAKFITPNINDKNIISEYVAYAPPAASWAQHALVSKLAIPVATLVVLGAIKWARSSRR